MTHDTFRARLKAAGINISQFARWCGLSYSTVAYWGKPRPGSGVAPVPAWAGLLLDAWIQFPELVAECRPKITAISPGE